MQLVILAGGKGTRLGLTDIPKPMCLVDGKPLLERQIELAILYGIKEIFLLEGHLANVIQEYFGDGSKYGIKIHHIVEEKPLGTAGCLRLIKDKLNDRFLVFYGDVVMDFDIEAFVKFDKETDCLGSLLVHPNNHPYDSDLIKIDDEKNIIKILSKPHPDGMIYNNLVNAAVYILSPKIIDFIEDDVSQDFGKNIFPKVLEKGEKLRAYKSAEYIKDMGTKDRLPAICDDMHNGKVARLNKKNIRPAIFLDRDGVINEDMDTNPHADNLKLIPGVVDAVKIINKSDFLSIVVTNQPMIAKGFVTKDEVENTNAKLETLLGYEHAFLDAIYYCPHHPEKGFDGEIPELKIDCNCRKPKAGMFLQAQKDFNIDLARSWMIGDRDTDMLAGKNAGCKTILVGNTIAQSEYADYKCENLRDAIDLIMENCQ